MGKFTHHLGAERNITRPHQAVSVHGPVEGREDRAAPGAPSAQEAVASDPWDRLPISGKHAGRNPFARGNHGGLQGNFCSRVSWVARTDFVHPEYVESELFGG